MRILFKDLRLVPWETRFSSPFPLNEISLLEDKGLIEHYLKEASYQARSKGGARFSGQLVSFLRVYPVGKMGKSTRILVNFEPK